uniref:Phenylalanine--tRNA ligase beta subunit, chloroplastic n=1 Tax=Porphyra purpurea TaxID=2787 RepID=SYFB_PORPU|nr:phenylalanyl-tRNA synthetase beta chain [Porphyra purpurea]P51346.1 RecName: Full=Phenylalanine--tRNA ligase beta subunit, chloroplastic; AltName: Full=Phenylalanyl-tRNA synthetase beta subunit; Short=PheRS [Porphyra purpurea]AAC08232.1 phenylalanine tRNA synthetase [Porphyra purpurea]
MNFLNKSLIRDSVVLQNRWKIIMKVSLNWLKELAKIEIIDAHSLANKLTQAGFEVEDVEMVNIDGHKDYILDVTSTANRSDVLSMIGLSREVSALTQADIVKTADIPSAGLFDNISTIISDDSLLNCSYYVSAIMDNIVIQDSPKWLKNRLYSCGFISQNLIIDISNYIMLKWGQPINIIDLKKIADTNTESYIEITSNFCSSKQKSVKLDNKDIALSRDVLITQINNNITSIAGIGINQEFHVDQNTKLIFIEAAIFKEAVVRKSSRSIGIRTESSIRQERGLNIDNGRSAYRETLSLLIELTHGKVKATFLKKETENSTLNIDISLKKIQDVLGPIKDNHTVRFLSFDEIENTLKSLQFKITKKDVKKFNVIIPSYRKYDVFREIDIVEEIARVYGYNQFQSKIPKIQFTKHPSSRRNFIDQIRNILRNLGLTELVHYSLVKSKGEINLKNPLIKDYSTLRSSLLEGLINASAYNIKQSNQTVDGFEIGTVFNLKRNKIIETTKLAIILGGSLDIRSEWSEPAHSLNWYEAKGIIENFFRKLNKSIQWVKRESSNDQINFIQNNKSATLTYNNDNIGLFGELNELTSSQFGFNTELFVLEIDLDILQYSDPEINYLSYRIQPYSKYPCITRDLCIVIPKKMQINSLFQLLNQFNDNDLENMTLFDQYSNKLLGNGKKSIGLRFTYRSDHKTLTNLEIDNKQNELQKNIIKKLNLEIRK